jgi:fermentation-respiration switch protein FrsA (DUF1100 family)
MPSTLQQTPATTPSRGGRARRPLGDVGLFRLAAAVVALYVLDDSYGHPELGVSARDHLVSGLVPLGVIVLLALAYPRLRPGGRAATALTLGALALVGSATDGLRHIAVDRLAGDDVSAVLAGLAGIALVALGARTLWRSRRREGTRASRFARRALRVVAALVVIVLIVMPIGIAILATHKARAPVRAADLGSGYERVTFETRDGVSLAGWYVPSRNGAAVIAFPGRSGPVPHARMLVRHGYGVLLFDRRGEGESEGDLNLYGWNGEADVSAAVGFLRRRPDVDPDRIGGLGLSVGGELLLAAAAHDDHLRAVVSEGAGARSLAEHRHLPGVGRLQRWLTPWVVQTGALAIFSNTSPPDDLAELVATIAPRPVLLIQAGNGAGGEELNRAYYAAAGRPKALWVVADGGHTGALAADAAEYERRVVGFLDRALLG